MSQEFIQKLTKEINKNESLEDKQIQLLRFQFYKRSGILKVILKSMESLNSQEEEKLKRLIIKNLGFDINIELLCYKDVTNVSLEEINEKHWFNVAEEIAKKFPLCRPMLYSQNRKIENNMINIYSGNQTLLNHVLNKKINLLLATNINDIFNVCTKVNFKFDDTLLINEEYETTKKQENLKIIKEVMNNREVYKENKPNNTSQNNDKKDNYYKRNENKSDYSSYKKEPKDENTILGRSIKIEATSIKDIDETTGYVAIIGEVFKTDIIETKTGKTILTFYVTDYTSSITVKCFLKSQDKESVLDEVKKGLYCKVRGEAVYDTYAREVVIMGRDIAKMKKINRMDGAREKRIELHLHTNMSSMDGITCASKLIETASKWGHEAIAITDHGVVQAYPEAQTASKKNKIKILYGVEGYLVDNGVPIVINEKGNSLEDTFVVFDIETTGFSPVNDKIIEIGAVKIKNGEVIDKFSCFVNPERDIPYKITELTSINSDMVKNEENIQNVLPKFMEFCGECVIVAHNASFDTGFIKKNCRDLGIMFDLPIMDTVTLARFLYPELKKVKLNIVAKYLGISLENHHRAIDDAKATAEILLKSFEKIQEDYEIQDLRSLNELFLSKVDIKKQPTYHIIILAKTQEGLKNLYKLVSEAHINNFFRRPRTPKTLLSEMREGLIIGSACEAGELYRAILDGRSDQELKEIIEFYDYLEIQPIANNNFLLVKGSVRDEEELRNINKRIYRLGKECNKPTVATGDVHFLNPNDEAFRKIIMAGQGFSDADKQPPLYLKTTEEMLNEFSYLGEDIAKEVVIYNPKKISDSINVLKPIPDETYPPKIEGAEEDIKNMTLKKVHDIYGEVLPEVVQKRLDKELNSIINNGYAVLYLIAQKLVAKSTEDGYLVGSRGSVGSSFVATMSDITEVNGLPPHYVCTKCKKSEFFLDGSVSSGADLPDKNCPDCNIPYKKDGHDIPFETFLGFEGDKEPDIDLNFSGEYQGVVHRYTEVLFGKGHTFKAGTIGTVAEKTAYGYVKKYLDEREIRASQAEIERLTMGCTGIKRTTGQHPGGIMVVPSDNEIYNFCPIQHPADDNDTDIVTTHFDYHSISGRLLKLDILGHDDPTVLRMLQDLTGLDPKTIPLNDEKVMSLFISPEALGVTKEELECEVGSYGLPEFGTKFVRGMLVDTQPKSFADLVRISGLSHGTDVWLNNAQYYIKEGFTTLKDCIATRDDIMVYLMYKELPPKVAFTIMEKVRKGKGLSEDDEKIMKEHKVPDWYIDSCKKIKYMFPKGHAVAYVMMAVRIAYYKVYYPQAYYATYFTVRADDFDADLICSGEGAIHNKLQELYEFGNKATVKDKGLITILELSFEMNKRGIKFLRVDLYKSEATKFIIEGEMLRPPLNALQGVGDNAAKSIVQERVNGEFISKEDLRLRAKVSKTVIETLSNHGCLEGLSETNQLSLF
ncbi:PolC-type DNA polymerase III [Clostridium uliginosum]|uniref:DNA polymerase III PolC-type n=1 Tax=Clostridium uliginosum TaxID=119641 RepID=A0A1I1LTU5_9CLOT|nr:PolC-type DNA polymerase III [Clostridium uliginosum]SFC73723.1 DNA polymerase-3 subunit alpha [Clostridium uliginosum]